MPVSPPARRPALRTRRAPSARGRGAPGPRARTHARTRGRGQARARLSRLSGAEAQGEAACRGSPGSRRRGGRGRMAEGAQPQQPLQLGPGAAARGMKRESELELPVPGGGGDGAEPGLSKRPRTEEAAADDDDGGMQVTARDGRPVTAGVRRGARRGGVGGRRRRPGLPRRGAGRTRGVLEVGGGRPGPGGKVGQLGWDAKVQGGTLAWPRGPWFPRGRRDTTRGRTGVLGDRTWLRWVPFPQPSLRAPRGGEGARRSRVSAPRAAGLRWRARGRGGTPPGKERRVGRPRPARGEEGSGVRSGRRTPREPEGAVAPTVGAIAGRVAAWWGRRGAQARSLTCGWVCRDTSLPVPGRFASSTGSWALTSMGTSVRMPVGLGHWRKNWKPPIGFRVWSLSGRCLL